MQQESILGVVVIKIFVLDDDNVWQQSTNGVEGQAFQADVKVSTFNFQVPGKFTAKQAIKYYT